MNDFKRAIIQYWNPKNKNLGQLSKDMNVTQSLLSKWIHNVNEIPLHRKIQIAQLFNVDSRIIFPVDKEIDNES